MYCHKCKRNWNKGGFCPLCGEKLDEKDNTRSEIEKSRLRKKRIFFCLLLLLSIIVIVVVKVSLKSKADQVVDYCLEDKRDKALEYYNNYIVGKIQEEEKLNQLIQEKIETFFEQYNYGDIAYDDCIYKIDCFSDVKPEIVQQNKEELKGLKASKESFAAGEHSYESNDYKDALREYAKVIEIDSNYSIAQEHFNTCYDIVVTSNMTEAEMAADTGNYIRASYLMDEISDYIKEEDKEKYDMAATKYFAYLKDGLLQSLDVDEIFGYFYIEKDWQQVYTGFEKIIDASILSLDEIDGKIIANMGIRISNEMFEVTVPYEIIYVNNGIWTVESTKIGDIDSAPIQWQVYAILAKETSWDKWHEDTPYVFYSMEFYCKSDDKIAFTANQASGLDEGYYYEDGLLKQEKIYGDNVIYNYFYDTEGRCIERSSAKRGYYWEYDNNGNLLRQIENSYRVLITENEYENNLRVHQTVSEDGFIIYDRYYYYDENDFLIQMDETRSFNYGGEASSYYHTYYYKNDENGNALEITKSSLDGGIGERRQYTYYENGEKKSFMNYLNGWEQEPQQIWEYDEKGNIIHKVESEGEYFYTFDEQGREIMGEIHDKDDGSVKYKEVIEYTRLEEEKIMDEYLMELY